MLDLLTKLKKACHDLGIDLINAEINGNSIKLYCGVNGQRNTEVNAYVVSTPNGLKFYTVKPDGHKSEEVILKEEEVIPTLRSVVNPGCPMCKVEKPVDELGDEIVVIEVEDGVFDEKKCRKGTYKNSRYAYSDKYHKMGTIVEIRGINMRKSEFDDLFSKAVTVSTQEFDKVPDDTEVIALEQLPGPGSPKPRKAKAKEFKGNWTQTAIKKSGDMYLISQGPMARIQNSEELNSKVDDSEVPSDAKITVNFTEPAGKTVVKGVSKDEALRLLEVARKTKSNAGINKTSKGEYTLSVQKVSEVDSIMKQLVSKYGSKDIEKNS